MLPEPWKSMETAPKDRLIYVLAMELPAQTNDPFQLPYLITQTQWHEDAGFLICTVRTEIAWCELSEFASDITGTWAWPPSTPPKDGGVYSDGSRGVRA